MSLHDMERSMWSDDEVYALLGIWCDASVLGKLDGTCRNAQVYKDICKRMGDKGFIRTVNQVKYKMKNMKKDYRKLIDHNRSGRRRTIKFQKELSKIMGDKPSATAACVMEIGSADPQQEFPSTEEGDGWTITYVDEEIDVKNDSQELKKCERDESQDDNSTQEPSPLGSPLRSPPGSPPGSPLVSVPVESTPGPSGTMQTRKRRASSDSGRSKQENSIKSMLDAFQKWQDKSDQRYFHEERKRYKEQRDADEKWRASMLTQETRLIDSMTSFMAVMTSMIAGQRPPVPVMGWPGAAPVMTGMGAGQRPPAPLAGWPGPVPTQNVNSPQVQPHPNQDQPTPWDFSSRISSPQPGQPGVEEKGASVPTDSTQKP